MVMLAVVLLTAALVALCFGLGLLTVPDQATRRRAQQLAARPEPTGGKRLTMPGNRIERGWLARFTPPALLARIERNLVLAGRPDGWPLDKIIVAKPVGLLLGALFFLLMLSDGSTPLVLFGLAMIPLGYFLPDLLIYNLATKRQKEIQRELPDLLDQIVISIEAGVGFEAALARAAERNTGPLADEVLRLVQDIALGLSRREAYLAMAERTSVDELRGFCRAIVQAEEYGVSIASVVRSQAKELRISRRLRAEAEAQKVPVKILLPLITCVLPVLFVIVLGPAVVSAYAR
ncbi:type II secretion system F family protein [Aeromicrobium sp. YIM 150415]|uniref:type II secretion system F family protein n=1 Tax=Aeromicrobium sp. YIM 150415 TaxID=2803912 RepID=UPI0019664A84|nr:type II secretion system F family protein [Aeromicrobium sp. YIM 150415]MBM9464432.1 type II secretion system F family protein [Aeromicrobium sp. YIM 150415]